MSEAPSDTMSPGVAPSNSSTAQEDTRTEEPTKNQSGPVPKDESKPKDEPKDEPAESSKAMEKGKGKAVVVDDDQPPAVVVDDDQPPGESEANAQGSKVAAAQSWPDPQPTFDEADSVNDKVAVPVPVPAASSRGIQKTKGSGTSKAPPAKSPGPAAVRMRQLLLRKAQKIREAFSVSSSSGAQKTKGNRIAKAQPAKRDSHAALTKKFLKRLGDLEL